jgi:DNA primase
LDASALKDYIKENNLIQPILEFLGCGHIKLHSNSYYTASNPDGNNPQAISVYCESLNVVNYTRDLPEPSDIFTLVEYFQNINFFHALKYLHELFQLDFYKEYADDLPESLKITRMLKQMNIGDSDEDDTPIIPISENVLNYYHTPCCNDKFLNDGIDYETQILWQVGYDDESNRITIPIRDETGQLISVKGRLFKDKLEEWEQKYLYLYKCPRNKILFGLDRSYPFIKESGTVYIGESEKSCLQLWSYGYKNCVAVGGKVSQQQIDKLSRLNCILVFAFDKDISSEKIEKISDKFINGIEIYNIHDKDNILQEKESPMDKLENWKYLLKHNLYKIK